MAEKVQLEIEVKGGDSVGKASAKVESLRKQLKDMKAELASGTLSGAAFEQLAAKAGQLQDRIGDVNQRVKNLASDSGKLDAFVNVATGIAGGFAAAQGAIALFGDENEDLQKTLIKVQGAVALLNGFQAVANTLNKDSAFLTQLVAIKTKIAEFAQRRYAAAVGTATGAMKAARVAGAALGATLAATGIGALVLGISMLIPKIMDWVGATKEQREEQERLNRELDATEEWTENAIKLNDHYTKLAIERAKQRGASDAELAEIESKGRQKNIEETQKQYDELKEKFDNFNVDKFDTAEKAEAAYNKLSENMGKVYAKIQDFQNAEEIKKEEEKTKALAKQKEAQAKAEELKNQKIQKLREHADKLAEESFKKGQEILEKQREYERTYQQIEEDYQEAKMLKEMEAENELIQYRLEQQRILIEETIKAEAALNNAKRNALDAGFNIAQQFAGKNKALADSIFAIQKGVAIAQVIIDTQKEIAGIYANPTLSALPDAGITVKTALATGAKIRAATSIATIAATAIGKFAGGGGGGSNSGGGGGSRPANNAPDIQGFQTNNAPQQTGNSGQPIKVFVTETDIRNVGNKTDSIYNQATVE